VGLPDPVAQSAPSTSPVPIQPVSIPSGTPSFGEAISAYEADKIADDHWKRKPFMK